jgi:serine protease AprX
MKRFFTLAILIALTLVFSSSFWNRNPAHAQSGLQSKRINLLVQTKGSKAAIQKKIERLGGEVRYIYENASVLAATVPVEKLNQVAALPNVSKLAKDRLVFLDQEEPIYPEKAFTKEDRSMAFKADIAGIAVEPLDLESLKTDFAPKGYANTLYSKSSLIWDDTGYGRGSLVAVVDSGTVPNACLGHAVIGIPEFPQGYNATRDGIPATDSRNFWHGTHVGGAIASACRLDFSANKDDPLFSAIAEHLPWGTFSIPILGQAPAAHIYPVKVFDTHGGGTPTSVIIDGLDHLLSLKRNGKLDLDVVNLSFGGPSWYDGRDILDIFLDQFRAENILVVTSAGNSGPTPNSVASPATSFNTIAVGALDYAETSRTLYEYIGLVTGFGPGQGMVMRPTDEVRVANFSSRGPLSDGRSAPDITAAGMWNFQAGPKSELLWASGTSFAAPVVAGSAALLNAYYENQTGLDTPWIKWRNALLLGADRQVIGGSWRDNNTSGYGAIDAAAALGAFISRETRLRYPVRGGKLRANILGNPQRGVSQVYRSGWVYLQPGEALDLVLKISKATSKVTIDVFDIKTPDNFNSAIWPNALEVQVQSARRSAFISPIQEIWNPNFLGDHFTIEIEAGVWNLDGEPRASQALEPGLMKISLLGDFPNQSPVSFKVKVTRDNDSPPQRGMPIARSTLQMGDVINVPVPIQTGVKAATFDLLWKRDWRKFPTSNIDMLIFDPSGSLTSLAGATGSAPERVVIYDPTPGTWTVQIEAIEVYKTDQFTLYLNTE